VARDLAWIRRGDEVIAVVSHSGRATDAAELGRQIGAAALLAVDNARLQAAALAELERLRESRARIVEAGDDGRRSLERDLHDGAQQHLVAVVHELELARAAAPDGPSATALAGAVGEARQALAELRDLAHGIFPVILDDAGLASALASMADVANVAVRIGEIPDERLPRTIERAVYVVVEELTRQAAVLGSERGIDVAVERAPDRVVVRVEGRSGFPACSWRTAWARSAAP
jgi:signal transduction histidine kinase